MLLSIHCRFTAHQSTWNMWDSSSPSSDPYNKLYMLRYTRRKLYVLLWTRILFPQLKPIIRSHLKYAKIEVKHANRFHLEIRQQSVLIKTPEKGRKKKQCKLCCSSVKVPNAFCMPEKTRFFPHFLFSNIWYENTIILVWSRPLLQVTRCFTGQRSHCK